MFWQIMLKPVKYTTTTFTYFQINHLQSAFDAMISLLALSVRPQLERAIFQDTTTLILHFSMQYVPNSSQR
jgi:hypothetical protein